MPSFINHTVRIVAAIASLALAACVSSPLPGGTVGALYQWDDLESAVVTIKSEKIPGLDGYYDGDFNLANLPVDYPELSDTSDQPWLFQACNAEQCYSIVLFAADFEQDPHGKSKGASLACTQLRRKGTTLDCKRLARGSSGAALVTGNTQAGSTGLLQLQGDAAMNVFSTLMANEVKGLPADQVRPALDALGAQLTLDGKADYATFIGLDLRREEESRDRLLYPELYDEASALLLERQTATVSELLGQEANNTGDLIASSEFDFDSSWLLEVDVDISAWHDPDAYLLVCQDFESIDGNYAVDYSSCPLKAPLQSGVWQGDIKLTGITQELIVIVMPLLNPNDPVYVLWQRKVDGDTFVIR